jgi:hypothetical protein
MSTRDEHLAKALQHAPDSDIAPSEITQKAVLDYADKAIKTRHEARRESWFVRVKNAFNNWQVPRWQLTGMGSLAASLMVIVMVFHENPDDPLQVANAPFEAGEVAPQLEPRPAPKLAQSELAGELPREKTEQSSQAAAVPAAAPVTETMRAPVAASAEGAAPKGQDKVIAKAKSAKSEAEAAPQAATIEAPSDRAAVASAPEAASVQGADKETDSMRRKELAEAAEAAPPMPAPVAAAPAPISEPAPAAASADGSADAASERAADKTAPMNKATKKRADTEQVETKLKADLPSAIAAAKPAVPASNSALVIALSKQGGQVLANKDIQTGSLRILYLSNVAINSAVDEATGYRKEAVFASDEASAKSLVLEVEAYNQTMREWHLNH